MSYWPYISCPEKVRNLIDLEKVFFVRCQKRVASFDIQNHGSLGWVIFRTKIMNFQAFHRKVFFGFRIESKPKADVLIEVQRLRWPCDPKWWSSWWWFIYGLVKSVKNHQKKTDPRNWWGRILVATVLVFVKLSFSFWRTSRGTGARPKTVGALPFKTVVSTVGSEIRRSPPNNVGNPWKIMRYLPYQLVLAGFLESNSKKHQV